MYFNRYLEFAALCASGLAMGMGCGEGVAEPASCAEDFECDVGFVCTLDGDEGGLCTEAAAGAARTFGAVNLRFANDSEAYLVSVFALPNGDAAADELVAFELNVADGPANALRLRRGTRPASTPDPSWQARILFEGQRHDGINQLIHDVQAGSRSLRAANRRSTCSPCGDAAMCFNGECTSSVELAFADGSTVSTQLVEVVDPTGIAINVLLDDDDSAHTDSVVEAVEAFHATLALQHELLGVLGHQGPLDRDQDGRLTVVFTNKATAAIPLSVVGFFDFRDYLPANDSQATGNQADILWSRVPGTMGDSAIITAGVAVGTLAHEYTHLVSFAKRAYGRPDAPLQEVLWLDEGIAHLMEDLTGWGPSNITSVQAALSEWSNATLARSVDLPSQRGQAYLFLRHLIDVKARAQGASTAADAPATAAAKSVVSELIDEAALGFGHKIFKDAGVEGVWRWLRAVYTSGNDDVTVAAALAHGFLPPGEAATGHAIGIQTFGTFEDARDNEIMLDGPTYEEFDVEPEGSTDLDVYLSGSIFYIVTSSEEGSFALRGTGAANVGLYLRAERIR